MQTSASQYYFVEVDIVMDASTPLWKAHDISQQLQDKLEDLPNVERAFVHVDHETTHTPVCPCLLSVSDNVHCDAGTSQECVICNVSLVFCNSLLSIGGGLVNGQFDKSINHPGQRAAEVTDR